MKIEQKFFRKILVVVLVSVLLAVSLFYFTVNSATPISGEYPADTLVISQLTASDKVITLLLSTDLFVYAYEGGNLSHHGSEALYHGKRFLPTNKNVLKTISNAAAIY